MLDLLPRFTELSLRMRVKHAVPTGTEVIILRPQGVFSSRSQPQHHYKEVTEDDLLNKRYLSPEVALVEIIYHTLRLWLNEDPLVWCQYGAKFKVNKIADVHTITLYPYPI